MNPAIDFERDLRAALQSLKNSVSYVRTLQSAGRIYPTPDCGRAIAVAITQGQTAVMWLQSAADELEARKAANRELDL